METPQKSTARKQFFISLCFYLPLGALLATVYYREGHMLRSVLLGYIGAGCVFFVPYLFKNGLRKRDKTP